MKVGAKKRKDMGKEEDRRKEGKGNEGKKGGRKRKEKPMRKGKKEERARREGKAKGHCPAWVSLQESKGYDFESETDTESIAKLVKYMYDNRDSDDISFTTLVERVIQQLVMRGAGRGVARGTHT